MRVIIGYPPLSLKKNTFGKYSAGTPLLSQNRQFQWFKFPTYIYPIVPAYAGTMLKKAGHSVFWLDGIAEKWTYSRWRSEVKKLKSDLIIIETKTPVVKRHWQIINELKAVNCKLKAVLVGDHVTALPEESFRNSQVDYILTGGDYDFLLLNLVNHLTNGEKLEQGVYYRNNRVVINYHGLKPVVSSPSARQVSFVSLHPRAEARGFRERKIKNTGKFKLDHDLKTLPLIDRELTRWKLYAYKNGNYKRTPGTYIMSGRDCWWHQCRFCSWTTLYPQYQVRSVKNVLKEIGELIKNYQVKEIMDDTGTFPCGRWLTEFCQGMIKNKFHKKIYFDCNLRFGILTKKDYEIMAKAGFRLLLYGVESANQKTLTLLNKGIKINQVEKELKLIKEVNKETAGHLEPHLAFMVGYPWETEKEVKKTLSFAGNLFSEGLIDSLQATIIIPYPGTSLFTVSQKNNWLKTKNWDNYDMSQSVLKCKIKDKKLKYLIREFYLSFLKPKFLVKKILSVRSLKDMSFLIKAGLKVTSHL